MEIEYLENFIVLAQYQNFSEAADALFISQSSLSKRIKKIEEQIGVSLINRTTKKMELNEYGELFLKYAEKIVSLEAECRIEIQKKLPENKKYIKIGAIPSFTDYHITEILSNFMKKTGIHTKVLTAPSETLEIMLENNDCDFAFIRQVHDPKNQYIKIPITTDKLVVLLLKDHPLANNDSIEIKQLKNEKLVMQPENSRPYNLIKSLCRKNGIDPEVIFSDTQIRNIVDFVEKGLGVSLLMEKIVVDLLPENVKAIKITPEIQNDVVLCVMHSKVLNQSQKTFLSYIKRESKKQETTQSKE